jgi:hypothetical protein
MDWGILAPAQFLLAAKTCTLLTDVRPRKLVADSGEENKMKANFRTLHVMVGVIAASFMLGANQGALAGPDGKPSRAHALSRFGRGTVDQHPALPGDLSQFQGLL